MKLTIFIFALLLPVTVGFGQTWTSLNSPTGFKNVRDLTINGTGDSMYAADEVTLLKSTDNGQTWTATSSAVAAPTAVVCKTNNPAIVLVSGSNFFKRSTNSGSSWTDLQTGISNKPTAFAVFPLSPNNMLFGRRFNENGANDDWAIERSSDGGATWSEELSNSYTVRIFDIAVNLPTAEVTLTDFAVAAAGPDGVEATERGLFYSENYGANWTAKMTNDSISSWTAVAFIYSTPSPNKNEVWAGTADGKLFKGTWKASSMTRQTAFPPGHSFADTVRAIKIDPNNYSVIYVATDRSLYKTTNGGTSWNSVYSSPMLDSRSFAVELNPTNSSKVILGTRGYIYRSTDASATWSNITSGATRTLPLSSVFKSGSDIFAVSGDLTVAMKYSSSTWSTVRLGHKDSTFLGRGSFSLLSGANVLHGGVQDNTSGVYLSTDAGSHFTRSPAFVTGTAGTSVEGFTTDHGEPGSIYAYGLLANGSHYVDNDSSGLGWDQTKSSSGANNTLAFLLLGNANPSTYYFAGKQAGGLRWTSNSGSNWQNISGIGSSTTVNAIAGNPNTLSVLYAGGAGNLWKSENANTSSASFTSKNSSTDVKRVVIDPRFTASIYNSTYLYWVGGDNIIYHSENSGTNSSNCNGDLPTGTVVNDIRPDPSDTSILYIATDRGIYKAQLPTMPASQSAPANGTSNVLQCPTAENPLVFDWASATGAVSYDIELDDNSDFSSVTYTWSGVGRPYNHASSITGGTTFYWRVRANAPGFGPSTWKSGYSFTTSSSSSLLGTPTLSSPANGASNIALNPTLGWTTLSNATEYKLVVSGVGTFYTSGTSYQVTGLAENTPYTWNVTGVNCYAGTNPTSATWSFRTCTNCPTGPQGPETVHTGGEPEVGVVTEYALLQNYPNPFNPKTRIAYALLEDGPVHLRIYNTLGEEVATLVDGYQTRGWQTVEYDAGHLPSGVYFYRLDAGRFVSVKKLLLMK